MNRREFLPAPIIFLCATLPTQGLAAPLLSVAQQNSRQLTIDEKLIVNHMADRNVDSFLMLNKARGMLLFIENSEIKGMVSALSGRDPGDSPTKATTPAGIFPLEISRNLAHPGAAMILMQRNDGIHVVVHRVDIANYIGEQRFKRLESKNPEQKRISRGGCINLLSDDFGKAASFALMNHKIMVFPDGTSNPPAPYLVVLPEKESVRSFFKIPTP